MASRLVSSRLIGRAPELAELEAALAEAAEGRPVVAFVSGESGVGKTRLIAELGQHSRARGACVMCGDCVELGEGELPYAPLVAALRPLARDQDAILDELPPGAREELSTLLPEIGPAPVRALGEEGDGTTQRRLFEALLSLIERLGRESPLVLMLEDIHWADRSTRAFLAFLASAMSTERVLVVCTYRSDELHRRHPLRPLLAELERDPRARRIELVRFTRQELGAQLEDILGEAPRPELVERLFTRSEGNPLYAEELLAAGDDGKGPLPPTLRDALIVRTERMSEDAQEVMRVLAVAQRADHALLADVAPLDSGALRNALRETAAGYLIVADTDGRYRFRHALLREVVHDDLLPGEHAELHLAFARALERRAEAGDDGAWITAGMAHHFRSAGDQPAALRAGIKAAHAATKVYAQGEAAALYERALELWDRVPEAEALAGASHAQVLMSAAAAHRSNGDDQRRAELLKEAVHELDPETAPCDSAAALGELASAQWALGRGEDSRETLRRALALVPRGEASAERADLLSRQVAFLMLQGRYGEVRDAAEDALEAAQAAGCEHLRGPVFQRLGSSLFALGDEKRGRHAFEKAIEIARANGHPVELASTLSNYSDALHRAGHSREGLKVAIEGQEAATEGTRAHRWVSMQRGEVEFALGEWDVAESHLPKMARAAGTTLANANLLWAALHLGRGDDARARPLLESTERLLVLSLEPQFLAASGKLRAELERRAGNLTAARAAVDDAIDRIEFCSEDGERLADVACAGVAVEADAAERAADVADPEATKLARLRAEMLLARVQAAAEDTGRSVVEAHALYATAESGRVEGSPDPEQWAAAANAWMALERPYAAAMARWREAEAHLRGGDREATVTAAREAAALAEKLGSRWLVAEIEGLAARARLRLEEAPADEPAPPDEDPFGLTSRERQVLALLAEGATNRQIGAQLFMAEKTASVHVSRILAKLDVRSRTEAAAVAHRHGLEV